MLWQGRRESENVEDIRGSGGGRRIAMGGGIGAVVLIVLYLLLGGDPQALFDSQQQVQLSQPSQIDSQGPRDEASKFVAVVLADTEDAWHEIFRQMGRQYEEPKLVLLRTALPNNAAGGFEAAMRAATSARAIRLRHLICNIRDEIAECYLAAFFLSFLASTRRSVFFRRLARFLTLSLPRLCPITLNL
jgi:Putative neutral zinc metallopeptidase